MITDNETTNLLSNAAWANYKSKGQLKMHHMEN